MESASCRTKMTRSETTVPAKSALRALDESFTVEAVYLRNRRECIGSVSATKCAVIAEDAKKTSKAFAVFDISFSLNQFWFVSSLRTRRTLRLSSVTRSVLSPFRGWVSLPANTHGLRRLHAYAAPRL